MSAIARSVTRPAHAKINLFLRVLGTRDDGYHDIESLIVPISLHDDVTVRDAEPGIRSVEVTGDASLVQALSSTSADENLAARALSAASTELLGAEGSARGAAIEITKRIPVAAGLGGGSADAAATLEAANDLWGAGAGPEQLGALASSIGSDVPAMLAGEPVLAQGRGERLIPVHVVTMWWVLKPLAFPVRARDAYLWWEERSATGPDAGSLIAAVETGDLELVGDAIFNDLQAPVVERHPVIAETVEAFMRAGALGAIMSGSGPTVMALARDAAHANEVAAAIAGSFVVTCPPT